MDLQFAFDFVHNKCKKQTLSIFPATDESSAQITFEVKPMEDSAMADSTEEMKNEPETEIIDTMNDNYYENELDQ